MSENKRGVTPHGNVTAMNIQQEILQKHRQLKSTNQKSDARSLGKKRQSSEDLNDLATAAKKLYVGTPTGVSPRRSARVQNSPAVLESPKAVYV